MAVIQESLWGAKEGPILQALRIVRWVCSHSRHIFHIRPLRQASPLTNVYYILYLHLMPNSLYFLRLHHMHRSHVSTRPQLR